MSKIYILNTATHSLIGVVQTAKGFDLKEDQKVVANVADLLGFSNSELTSIYNNITGETKSTFKSAKMENCSKVYSALEGLDISKLVQLDKAESTKVKNQAAATGETAQPGERKVRDSKLQRMAAAFREQDEAGNFKHWTIKELMEKCGTTEKITHQYISILRAKNDRFIMDITKNKEAKTFQYTPKQAANAATAQATA